MRSSANRERRQAELRMRLAGDVPLLLDGATGSELERRGHPSELPLWSTHALLNAPEEISRIHADYLEAGAEIITANTFRTQARVLARSERTQGRAAELTRAAVRLARAATTESRRDAWIAGSAPPLEDCYRPDWVPAKASLESEHREHANQLAESEVDLILVETMNRIDEAIAATSAARGTGIPFWVSFVCNAKGELLSGEPLADAIAAIRGSQPDVVLVNCLPPSAVANCLDALAGCGFPFGVYANLGAPYPNSPDRRVEDHDPLAYVERARDWLAAGARVIGGCCGTTPEHIRALREAFSKRG